MKQLFFLSLMLTILFGCKQKTNETFELKGKLTGITDGKAILTPQITDSDENTDESEYEPDTVLIKNGEFVFTRHFAEPTLCELEVEGREQTADFIAENLKMTLTGNADSLFNAVVKGSPNQDARVALEEFQTKTAKKYTPELDSIYKLLSKNPKDSTLKKALPGVYAKIINERNQYCKDFIKNNPKFYYSGAMIKRMTMVHGMDDTSALLDSLLKMLDPSMDQYTIVRNLRKVNENTKGMDAGVSTFSSKAPDMEYTVDKAFAGKSHVNIKYLAALPNDNILALTKNWMVKTIDPKGTLVNEFKVNLRSHPAAIALDNATGNMYIFGNIVDSVETTVRGKVKKKAIAKGAECVVVDAKGTEIKKLPLDRVKMVTGAKYFNGKLILADYGGHEISFINAVTGKKESVLPNMRVCCNILDFGIGKDEILVANLGAFRVQSFDFTGKPKYAFGKRGDELNNFHGCCNPVNVASLTNGAIVTVEKDPTRIKVYSKSGAKQIEGIKELVRGCTYIPMASDSKNNLYLVSAKSGIVKINAANTK